jgi:aminobenzoyl-glutamate utilization protein A
MEKSIFEEMIATRRHLHTMPEEGWTEFETTWLIVQRLREIGYEKILVGRQILDLDHVVGRNEELVARAIERAVGNGVPNSFIEEAGGYTGAIAILETGRPGPVTALRFDIDCVPVQETDDPGHVPNQLGFRSQRKGLMHACGHDGHTSVGLAVARDLFNRRDSLCGTVKFVFQPAEEGVRGAVAIAHSGLLDDVQYILGSHVGGKCKLGHIGLVHGGVLASTKLDIHFEGLAAHAGMAPEKGRNALMAACATAMMMAGIPRHGDGASRVSVGKLIAGEGRNVVPAHAYLQAEVRGQTAAVNDFMVQSVEQIVKGNATAYGVQSKIEFAGEATTIIECPEILDIVREVARDVPGVEAIDELNTPAGSEDYTILLRRVVEHGGRGAMFRWGCNHNGHHKRDFDLQDTVSMPMGFEVFTRFVQRVNKRE